MISPALLAIAAGQLAVYILLGVLLWGTGIGGFPLGTLVVTGVILFFAARVLWVGVQFILAYFGRSPRTEETRLGVIGTIYMVLAEMAVYYLMIALLSPFGRFFLARRHPFIVQAGQRPVLFLAGYMANTGIWVPMVRYLMGRGLTNVFTFNLKPKFGDIDEYARQVSAYVDRICNTTRSDKVVIVAHSMGGLAARAYIERLGGARRVAKLITIGTPHHGTWLARIAPGVNASQMRVGSAWLGEMNRDENYRNMVPYVSIFSTHDNVVFPQTSAEFGKARNVEIVGMGHFSLVVSPEVGRIVYRELASALASSGASSEPVARLQGNVAAAHRV